MNASNVLPQCRVHEGNQCTEISASDGFRHCSRRCAWGTSCTEWHRLSFEMNVPGKLPCKTPETMKIIGLMHMLRRGLKYAWKSCAHDGLPEMWGLERNEVHQGSWLPPSNMCYHYYHLAQHILATLRRWEERYKMQVSKSDPFEMIWRHKTWKWSDW